MEIDRLGIVSMIPLARNELGGEEKIGYDESFYFFALHFGARKRRIGNYFTVRVGGSFDLFPFLLAFRL